jgi:DNA-binding transcriptional ArsR family regulator
MKYGYTTLFATGGGTHRRLRQNRHAALLLALSPDQALTVGELSMIAAISPQNASGHLQKLLRGKLVSIAVQGSHRYNRLSTPQVAHALDSLALVSANGEFRRDESPQLKQNRLLHDML